MKERPILFSGPMVRAILDGRKTQTRRVMRTNHVGYRSFLRWDGRPHTRAMMACSNGDPGRPESSVFCEDNRIGVPGDRLWVRETHAIAGQLVAYDADGWCGAVCDDGGGGLLRIPHGFVSTSGSDAIRRGCDGKNGARFGIDRFGGKWRPSIHMPRWASRLTLVVTAVRVERLQAISEADAQAEGVEPYCDETRDDGTGLPDDYRTAFAEAWGAINGDRAAWASNPWVWVIEFKRIGGAS